MWHNKEKKIEYFKNKIDKEIMIYGHLSLQDSIDVPFYENECTLSNIIFEYEVNFKIFVDAL